MKIFSEIKQITKNIERLKLDNQTVGFVPTMGALHAGHLSLVAKALADNDVVVVSIFVNPTQFDNVEDLEKYPRTLEKDAALLKTLSNAILIYAPTTNDIYQNNVVSQHFDFDGLEHEMEGKFRAGHFDGVGTIVKRLFEIVTPDNAYFGEKDFQQLAIIKKLVEKQRIPVKITGCTIHREANGLAMSSRNTRLKPAYKKAAPFIYKTLQAAKVKFGTESATKVTEWVTKQFAKQDLLVLEYFIIADIETLKTVKRKSNKKKYRAFIAVYADDIRLIDNIALN
ncbi:pantoate--beta-alanine ligase [Lacinutrix sp. C3R15]|uniref:pantoate--beta-alanine ligase n=1 Tax=Flavobacteriaceae TaxID=49546 RepID=UPI001C09441B|nr:MULTISPECIES: pantoate--beta-alanine ligase [Flavobacteriaceae]MBU2940909.1 pantoate--beta-alanine ligase [Lacinutrix sp. C3R15]MDO6624228.1 pantoate--beta-alanine ligase [Oceanihabitans sp. 1_MG-2023]